MNKMLFWASWADGLDLENRGGSAAEVCSEGIAMVVTTSPQSSSGKPIKVTSATLSCLGRAVVASLE